MATTAGCISFRSTDTRRSDPEAGRASDPNDAVMPADVLLHDRRHGERPLTARPKAFSRGAVFELAAYDRGARGSVEPLVE